MNEVKLKKNKNKKEILVSDYILDFLIKKGVKHVFILQGGAIAFLIDAFAFFLHLKGKVLNTLLQV